MSPLSNQAAQADSRFDAAPDACMIPEISLNNNATLPTGTTPHFAFDNSIARELEGFYALWTPASSPAPAEQTVSYRTFCGT